MSHRLPYPSLMLVTDRHRSATPLIEAVLAAVSAGVDLVQLREPDLGNEEIGRLAEELLDAIGSERLLLNGRPELAHRLGVGVHLRDGQSNVDVTALGVGCLLGQSIHGANAARSNALPDYLLAGNVFETRTHPGRRGQGLDWLSSVVQISPVPVLAIGGVTASNVESVMRTGCHGVAVIDAILTARDPGAATMGLRQALDRGIQDEHLACGRTHTRTRDRETAT